MDRQRLEENSEALIRAFRQVSNNAHVLSLEEYLLVREAVLKEEIAGVTDDSISANQTPASPKDASEEMVPQGQVCDTPEDDIPEEDSIPESELTQVPIYAAEQGDIDEPMSDTSEGEEDTSYPDPSGFDILQNLDDPWN